MLIIPTAASGGILSTANIDVTKKTLELKNSSSAIGLRFKNIELKSFPSNSSGAEKNGLYSAILEGVFAKDFAGGSVTLFISYYIKPARFNPDNGGESGFNINSKNSKSIVCKIPKKKAGDVFECDVTSLVYDKLTQKNQLGITKKVQWMPLNPIAFLIKPYSTNNDFSIYAVESDVTKAARLKIIASPDLKVNGESFVRKELADMVIALNGQTTTKSPLVPAYFEAVRFFSDVQKQGNKGPYHFAYTWNGQFQDSPIAEECQSNNIVLVTNATPNINNVQKDIMNYMGEEYASKNSWGQTANNDTCFDRQYGPTSFWPTSMQGCLASLARWSYDNSQTSLGNNIVSHAIWLGPGEAETDKSVFQNDFMTTFSNAGKGFLYSSPRIDIDDTLSNLRKELFGSISAHINYAGGQVAKSDQNRYQQRKEIYYTLSLPVLITTWQGNLKGYGLKYIDFDGKKRPVLVDSYNQPAFTQKDEQYIFRWGVTSWWSKSKDGDSPEVGGVFDNIAIGDTSKRKMFVLKDNKPISFNPNNNQLTADDFAISTDYDGEIRKNVMTELIKDTASLQYGVPKKLFDFGHSKMAFAAYDKCLIGKGDTSPADCDSKTVTGKDKFLDKGLKQAIFVGNSDGFFRGFDATTGEEQFAVSPLDMLPKLSNLWGVNVDSLSVRTVAKNIIDNGKPYALDGDLVIAHDDVNNDGYINNKERALAIVSTGRGGRAIYAFNISKWNTTPTVQWEITNQSSGFAELGYTWSTPLFGKIKINQVLTDVLIFGGGYDPVEDNNKNPKADSMGRAIYIVNAWTGKKIWSFSQGMHYSIPSSVAVVTDKDNDNVITDIFAGDMGGQIWRFHIDNEQSLPSNLIVPMGESGVVANLASRNSSENGRRRIYQAPSVYKYDDANNRNSISVNVGTGYLGHPLVTDNQDGFYSFKFPLNVSQGDVSKKLTVDDLVKITSGNDDLTADENYPNGFYIEFASKGEKMISPIITDLGVLAFNTYVPKIKNGLSCMPSNGQQHSYLIDAVTGKTLFESLYRTTEIAGIPAAVNLYCEKQYCTVVYGAEDLMEKTNTVNINQIRPIAEKWAKLSWTDLFSL